MNLQPPDPPEYGHCLTCHRSVHESEVRGGHCIECEEQTMASKTIYQFAANTSSPSWTDISKEAFDEYSQRGEWLTRALLAAEECCHEFVPFQPACVRCGEPYVAAPVVERQPVAWMALNRDGFPEKCLPSDPEGFPVYREQPAPVAMTLPDDWQDQLFAEMERRFGLSEQYHQDHLVNDDTQIGVEFARDWIAARLECARATTAPPVPLVAVVSHWEDWSCVNLRIGGRLRMYVESCQPADPLHQQLADITHQRDLLVEAISAAAIKAGIVRADMEIPGPALLMLADDMADEIINLNSVSPADQ